MIKLLAILLIGLVLEAIGVVLLKQGLEQVGEVKQVSRAEIARVVKAGATNKRVRGRILRVSPDSYVESGRQREFYLAADRPGICVYHAGREILSA